MEFIATHLRRLQFVLVLLILAGLAATTAYGITIPTEALAGMSAGSGPRL